MKRGLQLDRVVLLGRTLSEYLQYFALSVSDLRGKKILDVASGVSSFAAEASREGVEVTAVDPIYSRPADEIAAQSGPDLDSVYKSIGSIPVYRWRCYKSPEHMRELREKASRLFLDDFREEKGKRYIPGALPNLPFETQQFDLVLVSYFLLVYQDQFSYEFHRDSIREIMRVGKEARIYPTTSFEGEKSDYLRPLESDPDLEKFELTEIETDFEFLANSNSYLLIRPNDN